MRNFSSRVEKIFHSFAALTGEIFFNSKRNFVSPRGYYKTICMSMLGLVESLTSQSGILLSRALSRELDQTNHRSRSLCKLGRVSGADTKEGETFH